MSVSMGLSFEPEIYFKALSAIGARCLIEAVQRSFLLKDQS
jgi:hypothetical protein